MLLQYAFKSGEIARSCLRKIISRKCRQKNVGGRRGRARVGICNSLVENLGEGIDDFVVDKARGVAEHTEGVEVLHRQSEKALWALWWGGNMSVGTVDYANWLGVWRAAFGDSVGVYEIIDFPLPIHCQRLDL